MRFPGQSCSLPLRIDIARLGKWSRGLRGCKRPAPDQLRALVSGSAGIIAAGSLGLSSEARSPNSVPQVLPPELGGRAELLSRWRRGTDLIIGVHIAAFIAQVLAQRRPASLKDVKLIRAGRWLRFLPPMFAHAHMFHLVMNLRVLDERGPKLEWLTGRPRFLAVYGVSALAGAIISAARKSTASAGASAASLGIRGALLVYFLRHELMRPLHLSEKAAMLGSIGFDLIWTLGLGATSPYVDNWGSLGGFFGGALTAHLLGPRIDIAEIGLLPETMRPNFFFPDRIALCFPAENLAFCDNPPLLPFPGNGEAVLPAMLTIGELAAARKSGLGFKMYE